MLCIKRSKEGCNFSKDFGYSNNLLTNIQYVHINTTLYVICCKMISIAYIYVIRIYEIKTFAVLEENWHINLKVDHHTGGK